MTTRRITALRHANAVTLTEELKKALSERMSAYEMDNARSMSFLGARQSTDRREALLSPKYHAAFASPAKRAVQTASYVSGISETHIIRVDAFGIVDPSTTLGKTLDDAYVKYGVASLATYCKDPAFKAALNCYGLYAADALFRELAKLPDESTEILVVGHGSLIPAMVLFAGGFPGSIEGHTIEYTILGETDGFRFAIGDGEESDVGNLEVIGLDDFD
ncbi:MAG: histidine phosphatase family protein [Patescibacteria group bacterium]|nr:phosphoglycerate mutase family protein [Patescibacteria group bacterium]MDE1966072.1 histidine phosphatase family protein [Patescibacteria group bacterium]